MLSVTAIRQRIATAISTALGASGWRESNIVYDQFPIGSSESSGHIGYAVGSPRTVLHSGSNRQKLHEGVLVESTLGIKWAYNLAAKDQVVSYDAALTAEAALIKAIFTSSPANMALYYMDSSRDVDDQGWLVGTVTVRVLHQLALI